MVDEATPQPAPAPDDDGRPRPSWWRGPLLAALVAIPVVAAVGGARLGCETGAIEAGICGATDAAVASAAADIDIGGGQTSITVADPQGAPVTVARVPTAVFPGQFLKFVVVSPDNARVLYVTASDLDMIDARMWVVPRGQPPQLLKDLGDSFWTARPVWCQARPGDPGRIAYVMRGAAGGDLTGLELWVANADGSDDRQVLVGTRQNGLIPEHFYGERPTPLRFMSGCQRLRYDAEDGTDRHVVDLVTGQVGRPIISAAPPPPAPPPGAAPTAAAAPAPTGAPCLIKAFAQTDPRWARTAMRTANSPIGSQGCALTSTAMVFHYYGVDTDPARLNACAGDQANLLFWDPVRQRCAGDRVPTFRYSDQLDWGALEAAVGAGRPAIVGLQGGPAGSHYVVVDAGAGAEAANYRVVDSWDGSTYKTLADFINPRRGYVLKWLVVFEGTPPTCTPQTGAPDGGLVAFQSPADAGVYNAPQTVQYRVAAADAQVQASLPSGAVVDGEGPHTVTVTVSRAGQVVRKRLNFVIDRTPPEVSATWQPLSATSIQLALTATDAQTQVTEAFYRVDDQPWRPINASTADSVGLDIRPITIDGLPLGPRRIGYYAVDSAGNTSPAGELAVVVAPPDVALRLDGVPVSPADVAVDLSPARTGRTLSVQNAGQTPLSFVASRQDAGGWLRVSAASGAIAPGQAVDIGLQFDPSQPTGGQSRGALSLALTKDGATTPFLDVPVKVALVGVASSGAGATPAPTGLLIVSAPSVVIPPGATSAMISLRTTSPSTVPWSITGQEGLPWLQVSVASGQVTAGGAPVTVNFTVDRQALGATAPPPVTLRVQSGSAAVGELTLVIAQASPIGTVTPTGTPTATPTPRRGCVPINWALQAYGSTVIFRDNAVEQHEATLVNDDTGSYWLTLERNTRGQQVVIDLGTPRRIDQLGYLANLFGQADAVNMRPTRLLFETSTDNVAYAIVAPASGTPTPTVTPTGTPTVVATPTPGWPVTIAGSGPAGTILLPQPRTARYVRVTIVDNGGGIQTGLDEVQVIQLCGDAASLPTPSATPEGTGTPTPAASVTATTTVTPTPTPTPTVTPTPTATPTAGTATVTPTPVGPTPTPTATPDEPSRPRRPTNTPEPDPEPVVPTSTPLPPTNTPPPDNTPTATQPPTNTPRPTVTPTPRPSPTRCPQPFC
jgi:hypothetical protein